MKNGSGCLSLIILVTFDVVANLANSSEVAILQIAVSVAFDLMSLVENYF